MIGTWSRLYKAFARCSALVATAEENICCEELCAKISASLDTDALKVWPFQLCSKVEDYSVVHLIGVFLYMYNMFFVVLELPMLDAMANILLIIIESMDFSPYTPQFRRR